MISLKAVVILACHNAVADWAALADRDEPYITSRLASLRSTTVTDGRSIKMTINSSLAVDVKLFDTMLLAPAGCRSLNKLSTLLGSQEEEKIDIPQFYKEHMSLFLRDHPDEYDAYALQDSKITLMLFFMLQESLNALCAEVLQHEAV